MAPLPLCGRQFVAGVETSIKGWRRGSSKAVTMLQPDETGCARPVYKTCADAHPFSIAGQERYRAITSA
jgi:hypothetical protein